MGSIIRGSYSSTVEILRTKTGRPLKGAPNFSWENPDIIFDEDWGIPGQMMCNIDLQWVRPGMTALPAFEAGSVIPRRGTVFFDLTYDKKILVKGGDRLRAIQGPIEGLFELRVIPAVAKDFFGLIDHVEAEIIEVGILGQHVFPGTDSM